MFYDIKCYCSLNSADITIITAADEICLLVRWRQTSFSEDKDVISVMVEVQGSLFMQNIYD